MCRTERAKTKTKQNAIQRNTSRGFLSLYIYIRRGFASLPSPVSLSQHNTLPHSRISVPFPEKQGRERRPIKMQRFVVGRVSQEKHFLQWRRNLSQLVQNKAPLQENDLLLPKMPPFDYSPPPYNGPSAADILQKRKQYLSPSIFCFYNQPVSLFLLIVITSSFFLYVYRFLS